jgi:hypothetical protein
MKKKLATVSGEQLSWISRECSRKLLGKLTRADLNSLNEADIQKIRKKRGSNCLKRKASWTVQSRSKNDEEVG